MSATTTPPAFIFGRLPVPFAIALTALILLASLLWPAQSASAHTGTIQAVVGCYTPTKAGQVSIHWTLYNDHGTKAVVSESTVPELLGKEIPAKGATTTIRQDVTAAGVITATLRFSWPSDRYSHTATKSVTVKASDFAGACAFPKPEVTPVSPVFAPPTCESGYTLTGLEQANVTYTVLERTLSSGPVVDVTYAAIAPYILKGTAAFRFVIVTPAGADCAPEKPAPLVTTTERTPVDCSTETITTVTTTTTTDWILDGRTWVPAVPTITETSTTGSATTADLDAHDCPIPEQPADTATSSSTSVVDCTANVVRTSIETVSATSELVDRQWVTSEPVTIRSATSREATAAERTSAECPVAATVVFAAPRTLAETGPAHIWLILPAGLLLALGGTFLAVTLRNREGHRA